MYAAAAPNDLGERLVTRDAAVEARAVEKRATDIAKRKLLIGTGLCFAFMIAEIVSSSLAPGG